MKKEFHKKLHQLSETRNSLFSIFRLVTVFIFLSYPSNSFALDKTIDLRQSSSNEIFQIEIRALDSSLTGHAFIIFSGEDEEELQSIQWAFGYYPAKKIPGATKEKQIFNGVVFGVDGILASEHEELNETPEHSLTIRLDKDRYFTAKKIIENWNSEPGTYRLYFNDCVEFTYDIAIASGLKTPSRITALKPVDFVKQLIQLN